mmetsp:Transcript_103312/g.292548  ORF Transcript_103312/g.292548 Transcript_103312/m.292548 type:complete len:201 (-) Transcript_103312:704-1306(-)
MYVVHGFLNSGWTVANSWSSASFAESCGSRSSTKSPPWLMSKCSPCRLTRCGSPLAPTVGAGVGNSGYGPARLHTPVPLGYSVHTSVVSHRVSPHAQTQPPVTAECFRLRSEPSVVVHVRTTSAYCGMVNGSGTSQMYVVPPVANEVAMVTTTQSWMSMQSSLTQSASCPLMVIESPVATASHSVEGSETGISTDPFGSW